MKTVDEISTALQEALDEKNEKKLIAASLNAGLLLLSQIVRIANAQQEMADAATIKAKKRDA